LRAQALRAGPAHNVVLSAKMSNGKPLPANPSLAELSDAGILMSGTPDQVHDHVKAFFNHVGGFGHFVLMGQAGYLSHEDTVDSLRLFAAEIAPRLKEVVTWADEPREPKFASTRK
jgi:alkanesulfonate monooxygenase SsuD/methylene tetrahydromethanopterin reductase-like flavin-dependent oxidoreductase (luciferase family)